MGDQSRSFRLQALFECALQDYEKNTNITLAIHPLSQQLENCHSVESIACLLQGQARACELRGSDRIMKSIQSTVSLLYRLSATVALGDGIGLVFTPTKAIHTALGVVLAAAKGMVDSHEALLDLLESSEHFLKRLDIYTKIPPTPAVDEVVVKIMVELISTLALATKELKQGRLKKFVKQMFCGEMDAEAVLERLDRLTQDEARTTAAEILRVVYGLVQDINGKASGADVWEALETLHEIASGINKLKRDKLQQNIRNWLSPPDPWKNHHIALKSRLNGTATWFLQGDMFTEWKSSGPSSLLWIHGKPGAGKSVLCSTIIQDIDTMRKRGLASLAFFYHDFREDQKKDLRGLLSSMLFQFCDQSDSYYDILFAFYSTHRRGAQNPSDEALIHCLQDILKLQGRAPIFLIVDALDECSNKSSMPSPREDVLVLVKELTDLQLPNLRICVTSRPEVDIKGVLYPLTFRSISLHDERGQMEDIENYIKYAVNVDTRNRRWTAEDKQLVIDALTKNADGMFRWVYCQVLYLRGCHPGRIRHALTELPETLDETYERTLREINRADWELAHRLFQCVAVASRPLQVDELAEFLAFDFRARPIPMFHEGWRLEDPVDALLSTCPGFLTIINVGSSQIIQFSHFSVKEFLTSARLAKANDDISCYCVSMTPAHTLVVQACLGILTHPDRNITTNNVQKFALAPYAALHWVDHARFEDVSRKVEDGLKILFDPSKPHLADWVSLHNTELPSWKLLKLGESPLPLSGTPLHYATICGLHTFLKVLVVELKYDVESRGFNNLTPLHVASIRGHEEVTRVLLDGGADVTAQDEDGHTPLHMASGEEHLEVVRVLLDHDAPTTARDKDGSTPLHLALKVQAPFVPDHGVDVTDKDEDECGRTPLHAVSQIDLLSYLFSQGANFQVAHNFLRSSTDVMAQDEGRNQFHVDFRRGHGPGRFFLENEAGATAEDKSGRAHLTSCSGQVEVVRLLVERGADATARDNNGLTPLHLASLNGLVEAAKFLVEHGADTAAQENDEWIPFHFASSNGHVEILQFLIEHGVDATAKGNNEWSPLHLASLSGEVEVARFLVEHGADVTAEDKDGCAPLHLASFKGHMDVIQFLVECGANVTSQKYDGLTSLHFAAIAGNVGVARFLVEHGADVTTQYNEGPTPLHAASSNGHVDIVRFLVEQGADVTTKKKDGRTALHLASGSGHVEVSQFLAENGADIKAQDNHGSTPLHHASCNGHLEVVRFLVEDGAPVTAQDKNDVTALHFASRLEHVEVARLLIEHSADPTTQDKSGWTPLHVASQEGHVEVVRFLVEHGADPTSRDKCGVTCLYPASLHGHVEVVRLLVEHGADATTQNNDGCTPLHLASFNGYVKVMRFLVEHGADATTQDKLGSTPLHWAAAGGHLEVMQILIQHGADAATQNEDGWASLYAASREGDVEVSRLLVDGADATTQDKDCSTPLHRVSPEGHLEAVQVLIQYGADAATQNENGWTPLQVASQGGNIGIARLLVEHGADVTTQDKSGSTPLQWASAGGHLELIQILVQHGADATTQNECGWTPLHLASLYGHGEATRLLVEHGADVTTQAEDGSTPLHWASEGGHLETIQILIQHGADSTAQNKGGVTPLHQASCMGHVEVARCLVEHGAIVTAQDNIGVTPLHLAIFGEHVDVAKFLIEHGAISAFQNGETSIQLLQALRNRYVEAAWDLVVQSASAVAQTWVGGLRGLWRRTTDVWNARRPL